MPYTSVRQVQRTVRTSNIRNISLCAVTSDGSNTKKGILHVARLQKWPCCRCAQAVVSCVVHHRFCRCSLYTQLVGWVPNANKTASFGIFSFLRVVLS